MSENSYKRDFFVILQTQDGGATPMMYEDEYGHDNLAAYDTREEAETAGEACPFGKWFGYEVHERGGCV